MLGRATLSKVSGKGRRQSHVFMALAIVPVVFLAIILFIFFPEVNPRIYIHQMSTLPNGCISSLQAYGIAIPHIREYALGNGRLIMRIDITFWNSSRDLAGQRGDASLSYPLWEVDGYFFANPFDDDQWPTYGYTVVMWADTAETIVKGPIGAR